jgi:predicted exporter
LTWQALAGSQLAPLIRPFRVRIGHEVGLLSFVADVHHPAALAAAVAEVPGALFFDQKAFMDDAFGRHRREALWLVVLGLLAVVLVVVLRYRRLRPAALAVAPALLAGGFTFGALGLLGEPISLLHLVSGVLMLSMGVDYGVFLAESQSHSGGPAATLLSIVIACLSTVLAFGLLGLSENPALRAIGLTTGLGVLASLVLAPAVLLLTRPGQEAP